LSCGVRDGKPEFDKVFIFRAFLEYASESEPLFEVAYIALRSLYFDQIIYPALGFSELCFGLFL